MHISTTGLLFDVKLHCLHVVNLFYFEKAIDSHSAAQPVSVSQLEDRLQSMELMCRTKIENLEKKVKLLERQGRLAK